MKGLITWLRRDRVAPLLTADPLREDAERIVRSHCQPIPCDIEDNYVCAAHRNASEAGRR